MGLSVRTVTVPINKAGRLVSTPADDSESTMKRASLSILISLSLLTACGGASDDDGNNGNPDPGAAISITPSNGLLVAQVTYQSSSSSGDLAGMAASNGLTGNAGGGLYKPDINTPGIIDTLASVSAARGIDWDGKLEALKKNGQWHVEVY